MRQTWLWNTPALCALWCDAVGRDFGLEMLPCCPCSVLGGRLGLGLGQCPGCPVLHRCFPRCLGTWSQCWYLEQLRAVPGRNSSLVCVWRVMQLHKVSVSPSPCSQRSSVPVLVYSSVSPHGRLLASLGQAEDTQQCVLGSLLTSARLRASPAPCHGPGCVSCSPPPVPCSPGVCSESQLSVSCTEKSSSKSVRSKTQSRDAVRQ